jgi:hypothetical protein
MFRSQTALRLATPLLLLAAVLVVAGAWAGNRQDTASVQTVGQGGFAATAFQVNLTVNMTSGLNSQLASATIPSGRRFVIERIWLTGTQPANQAVYYSLLPTLGSVQSVYPLVNVVKGASTTTTTNQVGLNQEQDGLYADGTLRFRVTRPTTTGSVNVVLAVVGHLEP